MTNPLEISTQDGSPVELFDFVWGQNSLGIDQTVYVTNADREIVVFRDDLNPSRGVTYIPVTIRRSEFDTTDQLDDAVQLQITMARGNPLEQVLATTDISKEIEVKVLQIHNNPNGDGYGQGGIIWVWTGLAVGRSVSVNEFELTCSTVGATLATTGITMRFQRLCPWPVYERGCRLNKDDWVSLLTVQSVNGAEVVTSPHGKPDGYFTGGIMAIGAAFRFIISQVGNTMTLSAETLSLQAGAQVSVYPGCDRSAQTCLDKFNNILNFGGVSFNPPTSPFGSSGFI